MRKLFFFCLVVFCNSCTLKEQDKTSAQPYFDLDSYFKAEAQRLSKSNLQIDKTVMVNGESEEKNIKINNWEKEFESFIAADINKASWKGSFKIRKDSATTTYLTENEKIPVKKVEITYRKDKIYGIKIFITTTNRLYTSKDSLTYYPDSLYQLKKLQQIKLMGPKTYQVTGRF